MKGFRLGVLGVLVLGLWPGGAAEAGPKKIAVLELKNRAKLRPAEVDYLTDLVRGVAVRLPAGRYFVMTRENILENLPPGTSLSECVTGTCEVDIGRKIGADYVVSGEVILFGKKIKVSLKVHATGSTRLLGQDVGSAKDVGALERPVKEASVRMLSRLPGGKVLLAGVKTARIGGGTVERGVPKIDRGETIVNENSDQTGFLVVRSEPAGAAVTINGKAVGRAPLQLEKGVGRYVLVAELGRLYHPAREELELSTEGARVTLKLLPAFGTVVVESEPSGAEVWLNGEKVGSTPWRGERKASGSYDLRVAKAHYLDHREESLEVRDGATTRVRAKLKANYGGLEVRSEPPGAAITLDGQPSGERTPHTFPRVQPGIHTVKLELEVHGAVVERAAVRRLQTAVVEAALVAKRGLLSVMASYEDGAPCEGELRVDGKEVGRTPAKVEVLATAHEVEVRCEKGSAKQKVEVKHNEKRSLSLVVQTGPKTGKWVRIGGGSFRMGSVEGQDDEKPVHRVEVDGFWLMKTEVTVGQYRSCTRCSRHHLEGYEWPGQSYTKSGYCNWGKSGREDHPMNCVDWGQAKAYCEAVGGRLPTEAEWEYAARSGGKKRKYPWGNEEATCSRAVLGHSRACKSSDPCGCGKNRTWPVCSKPAGNSDQGVCDLAGNVWEWVSDWYGSGYYESSPARNPKGPSSGSFRVGRGGGFDSGASLLRAAYRGAGSPGVSDVLLGFRCARSAR